MYDVLIIGCGITGAAAAFMLSKYRLKVGILERENEGVTYCTYLYVYDGSLRELMVKRELTPALGMGRELVELEDFRPQWAGDGLLRLECAAQGETLTRYVNLKAGEGYPCG